MSQVKLQPLADMYKIIIQLESLSLGPLLFLGHICIGAVLRQRLICLCRGILLTEKFVEVKK